MSTTHKTTPETTERQPLGGMTTPRPDVRREGQRMGLVTQHEIWAKLTDRAFITSTLVSVAMILGLLGVQIFLAHRTHTVKVVVVENAATASFAEQVGRDAQQADRHHRLTVTTVQGDDAARSRVRDGKDDVWLQGTPQGWSTTFKNSQDDDFVSQVRATAQQQALARNAQAAHTTPDALMRGSSVTASQLEGNNQHALLARVLGFVFAILFFMSALGFGMQIAQSVAEEKSSRVVEILAAAVPIRQLLAGKVLGNSALALGQMLLYSLIGLVGTSFTQYRSLLPSLSASVVWYLVFFVAGFLALACIWAAAGALASRQEDLQATTTPLTMLLTAIYVIGFAATGTFQTVMSFVPIASAILMPVRVFSGTAPWWQAVIALLLNLAFAVATVLVGERIYRRGLLRTNGRLGYREALRTSD